ncbi:MAG: hypothetical protein U5K69_07760 [Balneolaceae bacterium]|nr:hypothetical protein [Balneolaceae bacterium]
MKRSAAIFRKQATKEQGRPAAPDQEITASREKHPLLAPRNDKQTRRCCPSNFPSAPTLCHCETLCERSEQGRGNLPEKGDE